MVSLGALTPLHRRPLIIPGAPVLATGVQLRETLFAVSNRQSVMFDGVDDDTSAFENGINTPAGTHDGSDLTFDSAYFQDGFTLQASGNIRVFYTMAVATYAGPIAFVRWVLRVRKEQIAGASDPALTVVNAWTADPGPVNMAQVPGIISLSNAGFVGVGINAVVDPFTLAPWTLASLNARKAGFGLSCTNLPAGAFESTTETKCSEFKLEIWGP